MRERSERRTRLAEDWERLAVYGVGLVAQPLRWAADLLLAGSVAAAAVWVAGALVVSVGVAALGDESGPARLARPAAPAGLVVVALATLGHTGAAVEAWGYAAGLFVAVPLLWAVAAATEGRVFGRLRAALGR